ncbi:hypothetical protein [Hyphomicrobium sp.]|uniref:hypothetical protein n=1 Tax=Hyphomicrobium sp. TaxID=82 RepID=UPI000FB273BD|nr:hypothetical protein [Hyphomicrobium sp.]RUP08706.1 MAG: hypothetical protein EKK38_13230 [Hyphomicrobium sp.]
MFEIFELTAAPHFPEALKPSVRDERPENIVTLFALAANGDQDIEITMRDGEFFIALKAA